MADGYDIELKRNDSYPISRALEEYDGTPADLTEAASVVFNMATAETHVVKIDRGECSIDNADGGVVSYAFAAGDLDTSGIYDGEFEVTYNDASVRTFPIPGYVSIEVSDDLA